MTMTDELEKVVGPIRERDRQYRESRQPHGWMSSHHDRATLLALMPWVKHNDECVRSYTSVDEIEAFQSIVNEHRPGANIEVLPCTCGLTAKLKELAGG